MAKTSFCASTGNIWQFIGYFIFWFKIIIPLIIIILGVIDLGKAVVAQKDDEIKKATTSIVKRIIIGIVIFFIPTLIYMFFGLVGIGNNAQDRNDQGFKECYECLLQPFGAGKKGSCKGQNIVSIEES